MKVICCACGDEFDKLPKAVNRTLKNGGGHCCSRSCAVVRSNSCSPHKSSVVHLDAGNRRDEFSQFRTHLSRAKQHAKASGIEFSLTLSDLKNKWDEQLGLCPYTGWKLVNPPTTKDSYSTPKTPNKASLDRVNSSFGYVAGNVQFVAMIANYAKNEFEGAELVKFCLAVAANHSMPS